MPNRIDELSPRYIGEDRIVLTVDLAQPALSANQSIQLNVDYSQCLPEDVVLPLIFEVQAHSSVSYKERVFGRQKPSSVIFTPIEGGIHFCCLREAAHNRWWGKLKLQVDGELLEPERPL